MTRTQVYIPEELYKHAKLIAQTKKISISQLLRQGLELAVRTEQKKMTTGDWFLKNFVGKQKGKKGVEAAVNHNDIYDHVI